MSASEQGIPFSDFSRLHLWNMPALTAGHPGFHMPGHAGARFFSKEYKETIISIDTTELSSSDDLHRPCGPALLAMQESSRIYGSKETLFVTTGSTTGIHVMLSSVVTPDTFLLIPRTVHMSVLHVIALMDIRYAFITCPPRAPVIPDPQSLLLYPYPQITADNLSDALTEYPQATDILLVSPDYYGQCANLSELVKLAHEHGCRLLVDEAHGSHMAFAKDLFPADAMGSDADMCVQSLHKTLPALTMASQIHISENAVDNKRVCSSRVWEMLRLFETSSPSFVIAASSEYALSWMDQFGRQALASRIKDIRGFSSRIGLLPGAASIICGGAGQSDPMHLVLLTDPGRVFAPDLAASLENRGIQVEFADLLRLVLIISPWQDSRDFDILYDAVSDFVSKSDLLRTLDPYMVTSDQDTCGLPPILRSASQDAVETDRLWGNMLTCIPQKAMTPHSAVFGGKDKISIPFLESEGRICASVIAPYPPGIAVFWPGEKISWTHIHALQRLMDAGMNVRGVNNGMIDVLLE